MPISKFNPPPRSNLRERLLKERSKLLRDHIKTARMLQAERIEFALSPLEIRLNDEYIKDLERGLSRLEEQTSFARLQNVEQDEIEQNVLREQEDTLQPSSIRYGYYRSGNERNTAMAGVLERERTRLEEFTRVPIGRVQAIAAARRKAREAALGLSPGSLISDPCEEYRFAAKVRKQVMFAKGLAGTGYKTAHRSRKPLGC